MKAVEVTCFSIFGLVSRSSVKLWLAALSLTVIV